MRWGDNPLLSVEECGENKVKQVKIIGWMVILVIALAGCIKPIVRPETSESPVADRVDRIELSDAISYTLELDELPAGFVLADEIELSTNESVASGFADPVTMLANLEAWGREGGYLRGYNLGGLAGFIGTGRVETSVIVYGNGDGVQGFMDAWLVREQAKVEDGTYIKFAPVSSPTLGDASQAFMTQFMGKMDDGEDYNMTRYSLLVRRHNLLLMIETYSIKGAGSFSDALTLAEKVVKKLD